MTKCKDIRWSVVMKVIHTFVKASVSGGFHNGTCQVIVVEDFESPGGPEKNPEARIGDHTSVPGSGRAYMNATAKGA